ncbi:MAG TPA: tetratricopeptide repeat protein [Thermomonospora sp.]|nr:tetratricopeptide repeat protein [Thermomonospora sp.]
MDATGRAAGSPFAEELQRLLGERGLSWRRLAELTGYHPSWLSKIRHGKTPSAELIRRCDDVLEAKGSLIALAGVTGLRPAHLPAAPGSFVGREKVLARVVTALTERRPAGTPAIVTIVGPPGVGKTAVALRASHRLSATGPRVYADGQLFADLRGYSADGGLARPTDVLEEFLVALGVPANAIPPGVESRAKVYRSLLASRRILVTLDNASDSQQVEPLLPGSPTCAVIVTSRRRLRGLAMRSGAEQLVLGPLTGAESIALLRAAIGDARADAEPEPLAALADICGHLPLALRIAAERIASHPSRPIRELVEELSVEGQRLDGLATDDSVAVRTVFAWSYHGLGAPESRLFRLLGLHGGPRVSAEAAAALAGEPPVRVRRTLENLAGAHLVNGASAGRYQFHDLLRCYATERVESEEDAGERRRAVVRLTQWYLHTAAAGGSALAPFRTRPLELPPVPPDVRPLRFRGDRSALAWFDAEAQNFPAVIDLAMRYELYDTAWRVAVALWDYFRLLRTPGRLWLTLQHTALEATRRLGDRFAEGWVETFLAEVYRWLKQYHRSTRHFENAVAVRREVADRHGLAWALAGSGFLAVDQGRYERAERYAREALTLFREVEDLHGQASALFTLADVNHGRGRQRAALRALESSLRIFEKIGNHDGRGLTLAKMADVHLAQGDCEQALHHLDLSLGARRLAGSWWGEADGMYRRGYILSLLGRRDDAREAWRAALSLYEHVDDPRAAELRAYLRDEAGDLTRRALPRPAW